MQFSVRGRARGNSGRIFGFAGRLSFFGGGKGRRDWRGCCLYVGEVRGFFCLTKKDEVENRLKGNVKWN